jgi:HrpA-like RNA helicase
MHGKLYPVEVKYFTIKQVNRVEEAVKAAIRMHLHEGHGDILVFLTGSEECEAATRICQQKLEDLMEKGKDVPGMIMYQLYGALSN